MFYCVILETPRMLNSIANRREHCSVAPAPLFSNDLFNFFSKSCHIVSFILWPSLVSELFGFSISGQSEFFNVLLKSRVWVFCLCEGGEAAAVLAYCTGDEWPHCASLLSYSCTMERMLVRRCSSWVQDGPRCFCACWLRPFVSASLFCFSFSHQETANKLSYYISYKIFPYYRHKALKDVLSFVALELDDAVSPSWDII